MSTPRVFLTRLIPDEGLAAVRAYCQADVWPEELPPKRQEILQRVAGVDGILSLLTDSIDGPVMDEVFADR